MSSYRVDVRPLLDEVGSDIHVTDSLDIEELRVGDITFAMSQPPTFDVTISNAGEAFVAFGSVTARVSTPCVRCLCDFESDLVGEVDGMWARPGVAAAHDEDAPPEIDADGSIDLEPVLVAALVIEAPFAPVHAEDCAGLCPTCGVDLNTQSCACVGAVDDEHPFAQLQDLLAEKGGGSHSEGDEDIPDTK